MKVYIYIYTLMPTATITNTVAFRGSDSGGSSVIDYELPCLRVSGKPTEGYRMPAIHIHKSATSLAEL